MKNFAQMMKQAQELQGRMAEMQAEMERTSCEGRAGGGMVVVTLSGKGDMVGVKIDPALTDLGEKLLFLCSSLRRPRSSRTFSSPPITTPRPRSRRR